MRSSDFHNSSSFEQNVNQSNQAITREIKKHTKKHKKNSFALLGAPAIFLIQRIGVINGKILVE